MITVFGRVSVRAGHCFFFFEKGGINVYTMKHSLPLEERFWASSAVNFIKFASAIERGRVCDNF